MSFYERNMFSYFRFGRLKVILPSVFEFYSNVSESHCLEHVFELLLGISSCRLIIHRCQATLFHHNVSSVVHSLSVSASPFSFFKETFSLCLVYEIVVEESYWGKGADYGIFLFIRLYPSFLYVFHVNAETQGTIIDTYQLIVTKEAMSGCINEFLIVDGKKFPLPDSLNTFYLGW